MRAMTEPPDRVIDRILAFERKLWRAANVRASALDLLREGLRRHPGDRRLRVRLALRALSLADWRDRASDIAAVLANGQRPPLPLWALLWTDDLVVHRAAAVDWAARFAAKVGAPFRHGAGSARRPLRVGYLSADFRAHAVSTLIAELLEGHDRRRVAITGYSLHNGDGSPLRARLEAGVDRFVDLSGLPDAEAAARIYADGTDILVDLNGYTAGGRSGILARRPAPIQVSLLGFSGTMAADFIDYIIGDPVVLGDGAAEHFTERLVELPETFQPNDSRKVIASPLPSRTEAGLPGDGFVFCCFNDPRRLSPEMFDIWMRLLARSDGAVLWLNAPWSEVADNLRREAAARGVDPARLIFARRLPSLADHLARLSLADLALDTLPYGAHTTASDALWAGVPMVTCIGRSFAGRVGASVLSAIGLPELITPDLQAYEALALRLAHEPDLLAALRRRLVANRLTSPLFDCARYTRHLETAYETMWAIHCTGGEPRAFGVLPQPNQQFDAELPALERSASSRP